MSAAKPPIAIVSMEWDVVDLIESLHTHELVGFFDISPRVATREFRYLGSDADWLRVRSEIPELKIALAIDSPASRARLYSHYGGAVSETLVSPHAHISGRAVVGHATIVQRGVTVMPYAQIAPACKLNVNCTVHHEAQIGSFTTLAPGCQILGNVIIGDRAYVGAGAVIRQRCRIGEGAFIGAGAVVIDDIPAGAVVVGVPATRRLR